jgi:hypothetical protein
MGGMVTHLGISSTPGFVTASVVSLANSALYRILWVLASKETSLPIGKLPSRLYFVVATYFSFEVLFAKIVTTTRLRRSMAPDRKILGLKVDTGNIFRRKLGYLYLRSAQLLDHLS